MTVYTLVSNCGFAKFWRFTNEHRVFSKNQHYDKLN